MTQVGWMAGLSLTGWLVATALLGRTVSGDVLLGMLGPLVIACGTWLLMERTYRRNPQQLTAVMVGAFAGKLAFFAAYVLVALRAAVVQPATFVASFTAYFIGLYAIEALYLKRLLAGERPT